MDIKHTIARCDSARAFMLCMTVILLFLNCGREYRSPSESGKILSTLDDGLIAYYPFYGNASDESGNGNDGIVYGATLADDRFGKPDRAYEFDGKSWIQASLDEDIGTIENNDVISLSVWIRIKDWYYANPYSPLFPIIDKYESTGDFGWEILICNPYFQFYTASNNCHSITHTFTLRQWTHIVSTYNRNEAALSLYINSTLSETKSITNDIADTSAEPLYIGFSKSGGDEYAIGIIDDIRIYNRVLTADEINQLYHEGGWAE